jgi:hypothetical protein
LGASALVEFYVTLQSFPLVVELLAQPVLLLAITIPVLNANTPTTEGARKAANAITVAYGFASILWVAWNFVARWGEFDLGQLAREFFVPLWLTPAAVMFVYGFAMYAGYEQAFMRIDRKAGDRSTWRLTVALVTSAGIHLGKLRSVHGLLQMRVANEVSFRGARAVIADALQD